MFSDIIRKFMVIWIVWDIILTANATLQLLNVLFRHGDRTPSPPLELFPNDPYVHCSFNPPGYGKLTQQGRQREYRLGKFLRSRYSAFLGSIYTPGSVQARSTNLNRTKESLYLVLNALYPGASIPITFKPIFGDELLFPQACIQYIVEYQNAKSQQDVIQELARLQGFMKNLSQWTGKSIETSFDMYHIYMTLDSESAMNLTLPPWTKYVYPKGELFDGVILEFKIMHYNQLMRKLTGGMFVRQIVNDMVAVRNGSMDKNRKINLYSAHDLNIVAVLKALGVYQPHVPKYSSAVIIELHRINNFFYVKVLHYLGIPAVIQNLTIPGCEPLCRLQKFINLMQGVIPTGNDLLCSKIRGTITKGASAIFNIMNLLTTGIGTFAVSQDDHPPVEAQAN